MTRMTVPLPRCRPRTIPHAPRYNALHADVGEDRGGRMRGFGIVKVDGMAAAKRAIAQMRGATFNGRIVEVRLDEGMSGR